MNKKNNNLSILPKNPPAFGTKFQISSSLLPPADELEKLHQLNPEYVDEVFALVKEQQKHRIPLEKEIVKNNHSIKVSVLITSGILIFASFVFAGVFAYLSPLQALLFFFVFCYNSISINFY